MFWRWSFVATNRVAWPSQSRVNCLEQSPQKNSLIQAGYSEYICPHRSEQRRAAGSAGCGG
eukprot:3835781-Lingulodinium_polyedra.AAC.1